MADEQTPNIERVATRINVDATLSLAYPLVEPGDYKDIGSRVLCDATTDLALPTGEQTASLLHAIFCGPEQFQSEKEAAELRKIMEEGYLWVFNRNLWVPKKGVYVIRDAYAKGVDQRLGETPNIGKLEHSLIGGRRLDNGVKFSKDGRIAFAPEETYHGGEHPPSKFGEDGFVVASFGVLGAKKIASVAASKHFDRGPDSSILKSRDQLQMSITQIYAQASKFYLCGDSDGFSSSGYVLGVVDIGDN